MPGVVKTHTSEMAPSGAERREVKWHLSRRSLVGPTRHDAAVVHGARVTGLDWGSKFSPGIKYRTVYRRYPLNRNEDGIAMCMNPNPDRARRSQHQAGLALPPPVAAAVVAAATPVVPMPAVRYCC